MPLVLALERDGAGEEEEAEEEEEEEAEEEEEEEEQVRGVVGACASLMESGMGVKAEGATEAFGYRYGNRCAPRKPGGRWGCKKEEGSAK